MAKDRLTKAANISASPREIDFVTRFGLTWEALQDILGIMRPIRKEPGAVLKSKKATVVLQSSVGEGEDIPYSQATVEETAYEEMTVEKYAKAVSIEAIKSYGYDVAVGMTDNAFLYELQNNVMGRFYSYINDGALTAIYTTFQMALAMARGLVVEKWQKMNRSATEIVAFVNTLDVSEYLGSANITIQNQYGFNYIRDFMGYRTIFLVDGDKLARGTVIATPVENIVLYYVDPASSDFARAGLEYTVDGETNLIGFHTQGNYNTAVSEAFALMGLTLFSEYVDGIAVVSVEASGSLGSIANTSTSAYAAGSAGDAQVSVPDHSVEGGTYWFKAQASTAPSAPTYLALMDTTGWTQVEDDSVVATTNGHKYRIVELNGAGQAIATADGTVVAKT